MMPLGILELHSFGEVSFVASRYPLLSALGDQIGIGLRLTLSSSQSPSQTLTRKEIVKDSEVVNPKYASRLKCSRTDIDGQGHDKLTT